MPVLYAANGVNGFRESFVRYKNDRSTKNFCRDAEGNNA